MNKILMLLGCVWVLNVWGQLNDDEINHSDRTTEDEEIIGGIGGTGLRDMERPELLERPEFEIEDLRDLDLDSALENASDLIDETDSTSP